MIQKIGQIRQTPIFEGDANQLKTGEILLSEDEGYTIVQKRADGGLKTYVLIPMEDLKKKKKNAKSK